MSWLLLLLIYKIAKSKAVFNEFCDCDPQQSDSLVIVGFFSIGNSTKCGKLSNVYRKYVNDEANFMQEAINMLNPHTPLALTTKIVGVICDTCGDAQLARILAVSMLNHLGPEREQQNNNKLIGVIGDGLYGPAYEIARVLNDSGRKDIKQIVHFTYTKLLNYKQFPHLLQPLDNQTEELLNFIKGQYWSSLVLLYSDNVYDEENAKAIAVQLKQNSICSISLALKNSSSVIRYLKNWTDTTDHLPSLIFFSDVDTMDNLLKENSGIINKYNWILTEALFKLQLLITPNLNKSDTLHNTRVEFLQKKFIYYSISKLLQNITNVTVGSFMEIDSNKDAINRNEINNSNDQMFGINPNMITKDSKENSSKDTLCPRYPDGFVTDNYQIVEGDVYLLSFLSIHEESQEPFQCSDKFHDVVFMAAEAFHFAIKQLNKKEGVFKYIYEGLDIPESFKIGSILVDDCYSSVIAGDFLLNLINKSNKYKDITSDKIDKIIAIIGSISSPVTSIIARLAVTLNIPVISPASSSTDLNDKVKYKYFMRTIPDEDATSRALVSLVTYLKWNITSVAHQDNLYGYTALKSFKETAAGKICVNRTIKLSNEILTTDDFHILYDQPIIRGIIVYASIHLSREFLGKFNQYPLQGRYSLIGTESWGNQKFIIEGLENTSSFYSFNYNNGNYNDFVDYFKKQTPLSMEVTKWYKGFYEYKFCKSNIKCNYSNSLNIDPHPWIATVRDAVYAAVRGILKIYKEENKTITIKEQFVSMKQILTIDNFQKMKDVRIQLEDHNIPIFDAQGNGKREYDIYNYQNGYYKKVAYILNGELKMVPGERIVETDTLYYHSITTDRSCSSNLNERKEDSNNDSVIIPVAVGLCSGFVVVLLFSLSFIKYNQSCKARDRKDLISDLLVELKNTDNTSTAYTDTSKINFENESVTNNSIYMEVNSRRLSDNHSFIL